MSNEEDVAVIIRYTREIETILKDKFGATGTGLHSKVNFIEWMLADSLIKQIRYLATVRNDAMHNHSAKVDIQSFEKVAILVLKELKEIKKTPPSSSELKKIKQIPLSSYNLRKIKKTPKYNTQREDTFYKSQKDQESVEYSKKIHAMNSDTYKYNPPQEMRGFNTFLNRALLLVVLAGLGGIFYDYYYNASKPIKRTVEVIKKPQQKLERKPIRVIKKENTIKSKEKKQVKNNLDGNVIIMINNDVYSTN